MKRAKFLAPLDVSSTSLEISDWLLTLALARLLRDVQEYFARRAPLFKRIVSAFCISQRQNEADVRLHFTCCHQIKQLGAEGSKAARSLRVDVVESGQGDWGGT